MSNAKGEKKVCAVHHEKNLNPIKVNITRLINSILEENYKK